jgi:hypothetical protein
MKTTLYSLLLASTLISTPAAITQPIITHEKSIPLEQLVKEDYKTKKAFDKSSIHLSEEQQINIPFELISSIIPKTELTYKLSDILTNSGYTVKKEGNIYKVKAYDNSVSDLIIKYQKLNKDNFQTLYYLTGTRSFGDFEAILHLNYQRAKQNTSTYQVDIHVRPKKWLTRVGLAIGTHTPILRTKIQSYFQSETEYITKAGIKTFEIIFKQPQQTINTMKNNKEIFTNKDIQYMKETYNKLK